MNLPKGKHASAGIDLVDTDRYPIRDLSTGPAKKLIAACRKQLQLDGSLLLEGFIRKEHIEQMKQEVSDLESFQRIEVLEVLRADQSMDKTIYNQPLPVDHPALFKMPQNVHAVANDLIANNSMLRSVYNSPEVMMFLAAVNGRSRIYQFADEFQALNVMYMKDGGSRAWHYDGSDFVVTLMLQQSEAGGEFEYAPFIRGKTQLEENFDNVKKLFDGEWPTKITRCKAGALAVFNGRRSLHRVRNVFGKKMRIMSVLSYAKSSGETGKPEKNVMLYGERVKRIYEKRGINLQYDDAGKLVVNTNSLLKSKL